MSRTAIAALGWVAAGLLTTPATHAAPGVAHISADAHYALYVGDFRGRHLRFVGRNEIADSPYGVPAWQDAETWRFSGAWNELLYMVVWSGHEELLWDGEKWFPDRPGPQMWIGEFSTNYRYLISNQSGWRYSVADPVPDWDPTADMPVSLATLSELIRAATWRMPQAVAPQGTAPWGHVSGIEDPDAQFMWHDTLYRNSSSGVGFVVYRTVVQLPEPAGLTLVAAAAAAAAAVRRNRRRRPPR